MKTITSAVFFLLFALNSQAQVSLVTNQVISIGAIDKLKLNLLSENIILKPIKGNRIVLETRITLSINNYSLLEFVAKNGRYDVTTTTNSANHEMELTAKKNNTVLFSKGQECVEILEYTIYIPVGVKLFNFNPKNLTFINPEKSTLSKSPEKR
jgi:hypothetical protein